MSRVRVGLLVDGAPAREGAEILDASGAAIGVVTSGGHSPVLKGGIALAFVPPAFKPEGTKLKVIVRRSYGFRSYDVTTTALYHGLGNLPEPVFPHRFC